MKIQYTLKLDIGRTIKERVELIYESESIYDIENEIRHFEEKYKKIDKIYSISIKIIEEIKNV